MSRVGKRSSGHWWSNTFQLHWGSYFYRATLFLLNPIQKTLTQYLFKGRPEEKSNIQSVLAKQMRNSRKQVEKRKHGCTSLLQTDQTTAEITDRLDQDARLLLLQEHGISQKKTIIICTYAALVKMIKAYFIMPRYFSFPSLTTFSE